MFHTAQRTWQQNFFPAELPTPSNVSNEIWDQTWDLKKKKKKTFLNFDCARSQAEIYHM